MATYRENQVSVRSRGAEQVEQGVWRRAATKRCRLPARQEGGIGDARVTRKAVERRGTGRTHNSTGGNVPEMDHGVWGVVLWSGRRKCRGG